jgi:hypothetical protein
VFSSTKIFGGKRKTTNTYLFTQKLLKIVKHQQLFKFIGLSVKFIVKKEKKKYVLLCVDTNNINLNKTKACQLSGGAVLLENSTTP